MRTLVLLGLILFPLSSAAAQQIPVNPAPPGARTGAIAGQVLDTSGTPVADAVVRLTLPQFSPTLLSIPKGRVLTDREGRFTFADLPPGNYYLQASKEGYAGGTYGQRSPTGGSLRADLGEGERRSDVVLTLWKYAVIAGTVVDEAGEPVGGAGVRALARQFVGGRERFVGELGLEAAGGVALTDDRGVFRIAGLLPGTYVVAVTSTQTSLPVGLLDAATHDATLKGDLFFSGIMEAAPLGEPRIQQDGDVAMLTLNHVLIPPPPAADGRLRMYATTYYPAAPAPSAATQITLESGEERADIAIALQPVPAVRVSGRLITPDGSAPPVTSLCLTGDSGAAVVDSGLMDSSRPVTAGFETATGLSDANGRFTLIGVPPGDYLLTHCNRFLSSITRRGETAYWISHRITVGSTDLRDVAVDLHQALRLEGRIEFHPSGRADTPPLPPLAGLIFETPSGERGRVAVQAQRGAFATVAAGGQYIARPNEVYGWFVQSVTSGDRDITDRVFDLRSDMTSIVVTLTDRASKVTGSVKDAHGSIAPRASVLAFPTDAALWTNYGSSPRNILAAPATLTGSYTFANLPAGEYFLIAVDGAEPAGWRDPKMLETLAVQAMRLTVSGNETAPKTLDLTVKAIQ